MPIPLLAIFSCGVGVPPAQKFDEKDFCKRSFAREAGAANRAIARTLPVNVTDGTMDIRLSNHQPTVPQGAKINAIEIICGWNDATYKTEQIAK